MEKEILASILDWNPWIRGVFPAQLVGIQRDINLLHYLEHREIKILEGARRVGKSTLLFHVIRHLHENQQHVIYLNFDDEVLKNYTLKEVYSVLKMHLPLTHLFIDEIQNCKEWTSFLRKLYDLQEVEQIWITGSNSSLIKREYARLLTGRNISISITGLSFQEFLRFKNIPVPTEPPLSTTEQSTLLLAYRDYQNFGTFPEVALKTSHQKEILLNYFEDFLYKDIATRYTVQNSKLRDLALFLASNIGKICSYRNIASMLDLHYNTVTDYVTYFKESFLFRELYKFDYSSKKQIAHSKKIYAVDTGLAKSISFHFSEDQGRMMENVVANELQKRKHEIYLHKGQKECDFIIKDGLQIISAIQVCVTLASPEVKQREISGLVDAMKTYALTQGIIITENEEGETQIIHESTPYRVYVVPIWKWLLGKEE